MHTQVRNLGFLLRAIEHHYQVITREDRRSNLHFKKPFLKPTVWRKDKSLLKDTNEGLKK